MVDIFLSKSLGYDSHFAGTLQVVLMQGAFCLEINERRLALWHFGSHTKVKNSL